MTCIIYLLAEPCEIVDDSLATVNRKNGKENKGGDTDQAKNNEKRTGILEFNALHHKSENLV